MHFPFENSLLSTNINTGWSGILFETLRLLGVEDVVISSGSRCVPLIMGATQNPYLECISISDERSAAFFALGMAQRKGRPVVLVCTSGTAPAHYYPAVIEAAQQNIPLLLLTADRPYYYRSCNARQTINQEKLFGEYTRFDKELGMPHQTIADFKYLRQTIMQAFAATLQPIPGPVHLNVPFEEPLAPVTDPIFQQWFQPYNWNTFFSNVLLVPPVELSVSSLPEKVLADLSATKKGIIIIGPQLIKEKRAFVEQVSEISEKLGWPVLAEGFCPTRHAVDAVLNLIPYYSLIASNPKLLKTLTPEVVLHIGALPTSKHLNEWLQSLGSAVYFVENYYKNLDALHRSSLLLNISISSLNQLLPAVSETKESDYLNAWKQAQVETAMFLKDYFSSINDLFEPKVSWVLSEFLPAGTPIFVSSSMPLRDVEMFWQPSNRHYYAYGRRGTNGIDGILASALGMAYKYKPAILLTGDMALMHDLNSLLIQQEFKGHLSVIVINNQGGRIFEGLPIADYREPFERFVATAHSMEFQKLAEAYSISYETPKSWEELIEKIQVLPTSGVRIIEIIIDSQYNIRLRKKLQQSYIVN
jgi:2-succinyl-5-enolpyruvyl-6-hydroxy-3-cyclohexene-1-carboxylate synthase